MSLKRKVNLSTLPTSRSEKINRRFGKRRYRRRKGLNLVIKNTHVYIDERELSDTQIE